MMNLWQHPHAPRHDAGASPVECAGFVARIAVACIAAITLFGNCHDQVPCHRRQPRTTGS